MRPDVEQILASVRRASQRCAAAEFLRMKRGVDGLASIAATAPFVGLLGTTVNFLAAFGGVSVERTTYMHALMDLFVASLVPTGIGLFVATAALLFYKYLSSRLQAFDIEMNNASLELVDQLAMYIKK